MKASDFVRKPDGSIDSLATYNVAKDHMDDHQAWALKVLLENNYSRAHYSRVPDNEIITLASNFNNSYQVEALRELIEHNDIDTSVANASKFKSHNQVMALKELIKHNDIATSVANALKFKRRIQVVALQMLLDSNHEPTKALAHALEDTPDELETLLRGIAKSDPLSRRSMLKEIFEASAFDYANSADASVGVGAASDGIGADASTGGTDYDYIHVDVEKGDDGNVVLHMSGDKARNVRKFSESERLRQQKAAAEKAMVAAEDAGTDSVGVGAGSGIASSVKTKDTGSFTEREKERKKAAKKAKVPQEAGDDMTSMSFVEMEEALRQAAAARGPEVPRGDL